MKGSHLMPPYGAPLRDPSTFRLKTWVFLCVAMIITACLSLGEHDLADSHLAVPYPYTADVPTWVQYTDVAVRIWAAVLIGKLGSWFFDRRSAVAAALIQGIAILMLHEVFRLLVVNIAMVDGFVGHRWLFMVVDVIPLGVKDFYIGAVGLLISRYCSSTDRGRGLALGIAAVILASVMSFFVIQSLLHSAASLVEQALQMPRPEEVYHEPYGLYIYSFIYTMFIEPTLAAFFLAYLLWPSLPRGAARSISSFALLLLMVRGRIVMTGLYVFWDRQPIWLALAGEGQFFLETLILAVLTGLAWDRATRGRPEASHSPKISNSATTRTMSAHSYGVRISK
jgi:hypothetical protein